MEKTNLAYESIPDRMFIPAVMIREMLRVRPLNSEEKKNTKRGGPDVLAIPYIGNRSLMFRDDITGCYTYTNGRKIKVRGWQTSKFYLVVRPSNEIVMAMQVPPNHTLEINGITANNKDKQISDYIVCKIDPNGNIDRQSATIVRGNVFHKLCYIPDNPAIARSRERGTANRYFDFNNPSAAVNTDFRGNVVKPVRHVQYTETMEQASTKPNNFKAAQNISSKPTSTIKLEKSAEVKPNNFKAAQNISNRPTSNIKLEKSAEAKPRSNSVNTNQTLEMPKLQVTHNLFNSTGQRVGFVIKADSGEIRRINRNTAINLCKQKRIKNMTVVSNGAGDFYFRGIGISIDELPATYV